MLREEWLMECMERLRLDFDRAGFPLPEKIRASCSWPSKSALAAKKKRIGEAWASSCSASGFFETFISPLLSDPVQVGATLVHELVHCSVGLKEKHNKRFRACAVALGLEGKMTATTAGKELTERLQRIITEIGDYPHARLKYSDAPKKQTTRMMLVKCPACEYQCRTTRKWLEVGVPTCPCGVEMEAEVNE